MSELEPVVTVLHPDRDGKRVSLIDLNKFHALPVGAELYIIPDTHRVVSVELLTTIEKAFVDYEMAVGDAPPYPHLKMMKELRAIIDNKEQKE